LSAASEGNAEAALAADWEERRWSHIRLFLGYLGVQETVGTDALCRGAAYEKSVPSP